ncbi:MAG TPA: hypothetical protein V6D17_23280 [Candidatus Obscuribacterales bacterium]
MRGTRNLVVNVAKSNSLTEYKAFAAEWFRALDIKRANNDEERLRDIAKSTDDEILRRWLWKICIISVPVAYLVLPLVVSILQVFLWGPVVSLLWFAIQAAMGLVFVLFLLTLYFTFLKEGQN